MGEFTTNRLLLKELLKMFFDKKEINTKGVMNKSKKVLSINKEKDHGSGWGDTDCLKQRKTKTLQKNHKKLEIWRSKDTHSKVLKCLGRILPNVVKPNIHVKDLGITTREC